MNLLPQEPVFGNALRHVEPLTRPTVPVGMMPSPMLCVLALMPPMLVMVRMLPAKPRQCQHASSSRHWDVHLRRQFQHRTANRRSHCGSEFIRGAVVHPTDICRIR